MSLSTLRARAMNLISGGVGHNRRRSARATYLENAFGSPTHLVLSHGAEMVGELGGRARVCGLAAGETVQTLEGLSYLVVAAFILGSLYTRVTTGLGLRDAELEAAQADIAALQSAADDATAAVAAAATAQRAAAQRAAAMAAERARASVAKADVLAGWPSSALGLAESLSYVSAAAALFVVVGVLLDYGRIPSAVPIAGAACWTS